MSHNGINRRRVNGHLYGRLSATRRLTLQSEESTRPFTICGGLEATSFCVYRSPDPLMERLHLVRETSFVEISCVLPYLRRQSSISFQCNGSEFATCVSRSPCSNLDRGIIIYPHKPSRPTKAYREGAYKMSIYPHRRIDGVFV